MSDLLAIASAGVPVLCVDTCSIFDIMRDPTRATVRTHDRQAGIDLVSAAEAGKLICLMADQVATEFSNNDQLVQEEAKQNLKKMREQVERVNKIAAVYGAHGVIDFRHLDDHVVRARNVVGRWLAQLRPVAPSDAIPAKAFARVNAGTPPARRGKDSSKDCLVYETYLEAVAALRNAGVIAPVVFLSSNTNEYVTEGGTLKLEIAAEFSPLKIDYAPNMSAAKHMLGL